MKFSYVVMGLSMLATMLVAGCGKSPRAFTAVCSHPAVNGGMPFFLGDKAYVSDTGIVYAGNGQGFLVGAQCSVVYKTAVQK